MFVTLKQTKKRTGFIRILKKKISFGKWFRHRIFTSRESIDACSNGTHALWTVHMIALNSNEFTTCKIFLLDNPRDSYANTHKMKSCKPTQLSMQLSESINYIQMPQSSFMHDKSLVLADYSDLRVVCIGAWSFNFLNIDLLDKLINDCRNVHRVCWKIQTITNRFHCDRVTLVIVLVCNQLITLEVFDHRSWMLELVSTLNEFDRRDWLYWSWIGIKTFRNGSPTSIYVSIHNTIFWYEKKHL